NQYDASVYTALCEKGLEFSTVRAMLRDGGGVMPALAVHTGIARVPALQHGTFFISESLAIIEYLEEAFPPPHYPRLLPADPHAPAGARQLMAFVRLEGAAVRDERQWWMCVYPSKPPPLSPRAEKEARDLVAFAQRVAEHPDSAEWNIGHADLCLALLRLS